ncbi:MAG: molybdopterin-dependent oxidoreductase [Thermaerobacter sp.]|nr:molybdopterin-dependent oxidoreductase [Thermaerobacter sp.]
MERAGTVHGVCPHDCYDTCGLTVTTTDGRIMAIQGDRHHPITRGFLCFKVNHYLDRLYHPHRVLYPLRRLGPKGAGNFERVTWSQALTEIGQRMRNIVRDEGGQAVLPYSFAGNLGVLSHAGMDRRFFHALNATQLDRTICTAAASAAAHWVYGQQLGPDPESIPFVHAVVLWGANPVATNLHAVPLLDAAMRRGAVIWTVDPLKTATARRYHRHLALRPGTDVPLALGLGRWLIASQQYDREFVEQYAEGLEQYWQRAQYWTVARTAAASGVGEAEVEALAETLAQSRPLLFRTGYGVQRQDHAGEAVWAISALSILTGSHAAVGGGHLLGNSEAFLLNWDKVGGSHLQKNPVRLVNMVQLGQALTELDNPPLRALIVYNANPAATAPDQDRVLSGLARSDLLTVVHEQMMTETAKWADYVLPAAMGMEIFDLHISYWHRYVQLNTPAADPPGEAVSNSEFFRRMAQAVGLAMPELAASDEQLLADALDTDHPWLRGITLASLRRRPVQKLRLAIGDRPFVDTPIKTSSGRLRLSPLPVPGYPTDTDSGRDAEFPICFLTPSARETIKSTFANVAGVGPAGHPELLIHPQDMEAWQIQPGQTVRVENQNGWVILRAVASPVPQPGTVVSYGLRCHDQGRNVNQLTSQRLSDWGGGATFYSARVRIEPCPKET